MGGACLGTGKQGWAILEFGNGEGEAEKVSKVALEQLCVFPADLGPGRASTCKWLGVNSSLNRHVSQLVNPKA